MNFRSSHNTQLPLFRPPSGDMPHMLRIPAGSFQLGTSQAYGWPSHYAPQPKQMPGFWMSQTTVTNRQFNRFIDAWGAGTRLKMGVDSIGSIHVLEVQQRRSQWRRFARSESLVPITGKIERVIGADPSLGSVVIPAKDRLLFFKLGREKLQRGQMSVPVVTSATESNPDMVALMQDQHPATGLSLLIASAYTAWLSCETGLPHRLPTEFEWERAAKGGQDLIYAPYGRMDKRDIFFAGSARLTAAVDRPEAVPNPFGLIDMTGNVAEMTISVFSGENCPGMHTPDSQKRVQKNSAWLSNFGGYVIWLQTASRLWFNENHSDPLRGFRVVRPN